MKWGGGDLAPFDEGAHVTYPKQLFRHPGPYGKGERSYAVIGVNNAEEEASAALKGWCATKEEAFGAEAAAEVIEAAQELEEALDDISPPTRDELETKAKELGVSFNRKTKDDVLAARIAKALG